MGYGFAQRRTIVIGASRGIGRAVAHAMLREGAHVAACCRSRALCMELMPESEGKFVYGQPVDAADTSAFSAWMGRAVEALGGLDHMVWTVSGQSRDLRVSFEHEVLAFQSALDFAIPYLRKSDSGSVVVVGSQAALLALPSYAGYAAAKAAMISLCGSIAKGLAGEGIRINVVSPGEVEFPGGIWDRMKRDRPERYQAALARTTRGRFASPEEVANVILFAASPAASLLAGSHILADHAGREFVQF